MPTCVSMRKNILAHVHAVNNSLLTGIFADVLVKKRKGAIVRRGGQANDKDVKVTEHLTPHIYVSGVGTSRTFDAVKEFRRIFLIVDNLLRRFAIGCHKFRKRCFLRAFIQLVAFEDGIHSLNGADADLNVIGNKEVFSLRTP